VSVGAVSVLNEGGLAVFARVAMYEQIDVEGWEPVAKWLGEHANELNQQLASYQGSMTLLDRRRSPERGLLTRIERG